MSRPALASWNCILHDNLRAGARGRTRRPRPVTGITVAVITIASTVVHLASS